MPPIDPTQAHVDANNNELMARFNEYMAEQRAQQADLNKRQDAADVVQRVYSDIGKAVNGAFSSLQAWEQVTNKTLENEHARESGLTAPSQDPQLSNYLINTPHLSHDERWDVGDQTQQQTQDEAAAAMNSDAPPPRTHTS